MPSPIVENATFELDGAEPWPADAQLFQPYEVEQILLPDNANCLAVQAFLRSLGLPFSVEMRWNAEWMAPGGRVPFVRAGAYLASELEGVAGLLGERGLLPPTPPAQRAETRAFCSTIHNVLYHAELYVCWLHEPTFQRVTAPRYASVFPWPLGWLQARARRRAVRRRLALFGWAQREPAQVADEVDKCCRALTERLGDKDYFFGSKPCELDALVFGHMFALATTELPCDILSATVKRYPELLALATRIENNYFKKKNDSRLKNK